MDIATMCFIGKVLGKIIFGTCGKWWICLCLL